VSGYGNKNVIKRPVQFRRVASTVPLERTSNRYRCRSSNITAASKKTVCECGRKRFGWYDSKSKLVRDLASGGTAVYLEFEIRRVECDRCNAVKTETLEWLAKSGRFTKRFEENVGRMAREMPLTAVAYHNRISWEQAWRIELDYMRDLVKRHPPIFPLRAIGIDEISVRKGHTYRIVVADMDEQRPIWMGDIGRTKEDLDKFYEEIGVENSKGIAIAVMDMWKAFRNSTEEHAPQARIIFDKFHVLKHLSDALDEVRREEYKRVNEKERRYIKGHRYTLLSHKANLDKEGRRSLKLLLKANKRLHKAYLLKESFSQLWDYYYPAAALTFFENWKSQFRWQRLQPFEEFAKMIERHWEGVVSYCHPDNKVSLGFMEGLNNKIRVIQRRAYGIRNDEYLRLKVLTSFIKDL
jgi:transposase